MATPLDAESVEEIREQINPGNMPEVAEVAGFAAQFMSRVQLQGAEVPAFNAVMVWLESFNE